MKLSSVFCLTLLVLAASAAPSHAEDLIVIEDFESETFNGWTTEGDAFENGPSEGGMNGFMGNRSVESRRGTGALVSPAFTIERNAIHFLMGSVEHPVTGSAGEVSVQLLVDDEVVRKTAPYQGSFKFHAMFWESWDVDEFKGKAARIRIVDESDWAGINIDHIIQSDVPAEGYLLQRTVTATKPYLNFPVKEGSSRHNLDLIVDGKPVRTMDIELAADDIDYWVFTDLSLWQGKEVLIRTRQLAISQPDILDRISVKDGILDADDLYNERLRPQFHFSSQRGWLNDPNGLVYYDGEFHLYYQHNPYGWDHSRNDLNKTWGHAVSTDLVHWKELPGVIYPDHLGSIYSGSAVVDEHNTTGFQTRDEKPIVAVYTSAGGRSFWSEGQPFSQSIAYSNDRGRTFTPYEGNPVQPNIEYINRDPKAIWHEPSKQWVIVLHYNNRAMAFFTSKDLKSWEYQSEYENRFLIDCPELFQLAVDGDESNKKWILYGGPGAYLVGDFDGKQFTPETETTRYNYGNGFYASQTFSNMPAEDDRRIQIAWGTIPMQGMPFNMQMLFPVELTLHTTDEGLCMFAYPVEEIKNIHGREHAWSNTKLKPEQNPLSGIDHELLDIDAEFEVGRADEFGFMIRDIPLIYKIKDRRLSCGRSRAKLDPVDGKIRLRILVDRVSIEIFANDGRIYMPMRALPKGDESGLKIFTRTGNTKISSLKVRELKSIWGSVQDIH